MFTDIQRCARLVQGTDLDRLAIKAERQKKITATVVTRELNSIHARLINHGVAYRACWDRGKAWEQKFKDLMADIKATQTMKPSLALDQIERIINAEKYK